MLMNFKTEIHEFSNYGPQRSQVTGQVRGHWVTAVWLLCGRELMTRSCCLQWSQVTEVRGHWVTAVWLLCRRELMTRSCCLQARSGHRSEVTEVRGHWVTAVWLLSRRELMTRSCCLQWSEVTEVRGHWVIAVWLLCRRELMTRSSIVSESCWAASQRRGRSDEWWKVLTTDPPR